MPRGLKPAFIPFLIAALEALGQLKAEVQTFKRGAGAEIPGGYGGFGWHGVLRLRMTPTSWASCFAQDDRVKS
ncbi:MAG: hypothetical protein WB660_16325 [Candidatus Sulfotelmatobacter sp.]